LAAEVAHEINNPLTSILTFIKLVDKILNHEPFPLERLGELREFLSFMNSEATRCAGIARNLLDFARHGDIDLKDNDIHEILDRTLDVLRHRAEMNGIKIETHYDRNVPHLFCDFKRLQQAFMNMFWNGMEAMASGGVLRVSTQFNEQQELIELVISDTGSGIPEADIENIFEPFYTTKSDGKGVGLGLSVSYGIIRRHHGQVRVQSECGKGTTFMIQFRLTGNQSREIANGEDLEDEIDQQEVVAGAPHEA
jgi:two-component system NtrC family sensor kinase